MVVNSIPKSLTVIFKKPEIKTETLGKCLFYFFNFFLVQSELQKLIQITLELGQKMETRLKGK